MDILNCDNLPVNVEVETVNFSPNELEYNSLKNNEFLTEIQTVQDTEATQNDDTSVDADDILKNGILVETNKGVVCMTLKEVLSSNVNLSVDDFKNVVVRLLSQNESTTIEMNKDSYTPQSSDIEMKNSENIEAEKLNSATSETVDTSEENDKEKNATAATTSKRRGGWPKGRKRKPELLHLPPKAPKTSYNIFLNERRKLYKDRLAFHEITRVVGNQWSNLTAEEKRPYVERAEEDKKRYREELRVYRQSDAYKLYLARKRKKRLIDNLMSESDMDGTDDIDDEDNDMLYCDTCDQWFYNLHNKKEHLQSRQHKMTIVGDMNRNLNTSDSENKNHATCSASFSISLDESSMDIAPQENDKALSPIQNPPKIECVYDHMVRLVDSVAEREKELNILKSRLQESMVNQKTLFVELNSLKEKINSLRTNLKDLKLKEIDLEQQLKIQLFNVLNLLVNVDDSVKQ